MVTVYVGDTQIFALDPVESPSIGDRAKCGHTWLPWRLLLLGTAAHPYRLGFAAAHRHAVLRQRLVRDRLDLNRSH